MTAAPEHAPETETALAFAHPEARARAADRDGVQPPDRISLRDHMVEVEIGAFQAERGIRQRLSFNVVVELRPVAGPVDDDVDRILSYDRLTEAIATELAAERVNLLETLGERIADRILAEPQALRVFLRIEKLDRGPGALGVELVRSAAPAAPVTQAEVPHPVMAFLCGDNRGGDTAPLIDRLIAEADGSPLILCVDLPDLPLPQTSDGVAMRRIALLALEQNAWALAGRDARCVVADSRTELDWAMKNGQISIWAPSRIVLDTPDAPAGTVDAMGLAVWFANRMQARAFVCAADAAPDARHLPGIELRRLPEDGA